MKKGIAVLIALVFHFAGFTQTGKIVGIVVDENGETMPGVSVYQKGQAKGKNTDIDGKFIYTLAPGTYSLVFKFAAYKEKTINGILVKENEISQISVSMTPQDDSVLTEVYVIHHLRPDGDPALDKVKRKTANSVDGVTQATLKKSPATTASDALRRITGATIQDGKFAVIRGMSDRYNAAYINGAPLPSSESDRRAIAFDIFPSNLLDNITIIKTGSPNIPGEFAGGVININTKSIPDENSQTITLGGGYNNVTTFKDFQSYKGGKTDWLGIDDGTRALNSEIPSTNDLRNARVDYRGNYAKLMNSDWSIQTKKALPNSLAQYTLARTDTLFGNNAGFVFALNYASNNVSSTVSRQEYEEQGTGVVKTDSLHDKISSNNILASGLLNMAYKIGTKHIIKFNNLYSINSEDRVTIRSGVRQYEQAQKQWTKGSVRWFQQNNMYSGQLSGNHQLLKKMKFDWNAGYSNVVRNIPNMRRIVYQKTSEREDDSTVQYAAIIDPNNSRSGGIMFFSRMEENIYSGKYDFTIPVTFKKRNQVLMPLMVKSEEQKAKFSFDICFGGLNQYRARTFSARNIGYEKYKQGSSIKFNSNLLYLDESTIFTAPYIGIMADSAAPYKGGFGIKETTRETDSYNAHSNLNAGYGMFDFKFGQSLRLLTGVRYENYTQYLATSNNGKPLIVDTTVNDILPSANMTYTIENDKKGSAFIARAAYYRTVSRPEFRELAAFSFYDFITDFELFGNKDLKRAKIDNYDFRLEYYPKPGQLISGTFFYKKITNPTEIASRSDAQRTLYYTNVPLAINIGGEFEYRINLSLFTKNDTSEFIKNTSFFANLAYIKSKVDISDINGSTAKSRPMQGQSPYLINAGFTVLIPWLKILSTVSYNVYGDRLYIVGSVIEPDYWEKSRNIIDCQFARDFGKHWVLKLNIRDLLAQKQILYQDLNHNRKYDEPADNNMVQTKWGRVFSLNLTYNF